MLHYKYLVRNALRVDRLVHSNVGGRGSDSRLACIMSEMSKVREANRYILKRVTKEKKTKWEKERKKKAHRKIHKNKKTPEISKNKLMLPTK